ncbi:MAG: MBL fold metallo-hydrolase [Candidatus Diapherotrites archaeon]|nr:MBL fold metallo-hydrolase [Candidatus Diapherotrites archaeon]
MVSSKSLKKSPKPEKVKIIQVNVRGFDNNFSYLVIGKNGGAVLIDATGSIEEIEKAIRKNDAKVIFQLVTHSHFDHAGNVNCFIEKGILLKSFEDLKKCPEIEVAGFRIETLFLPGHTSDSVCFLIKNNLFTGDVLFADGTGRADFGGDENEMRASLEKLSAFSKKNPEIIIWPGHNYGGAKAMLKEALEKVTSPAL